MRRLFFGGSFNPIHWGHILPAAAVAQRAGFERIVLIPAAMSPHKLDDANVAPATHRLAMCTLAAQEFNRAEQNATIRFEINDLELHRPFPSYTIDTIRALKAQGETQVHWLVGADQIAKLPYWHEAAQLLKETEFVIMKRPGSGIEFGDLPGKLQHLRDCIVEAPQLAISATEIRARIAQGMSIEGLVPIDVARYIVEHRLYLRESAAVDPSSENGGS